MINNQEYRPEYSIIGRDSLVPRERIHLVPENGLSPIERTELSNLRKGVGYKLCVADTIQNREAIATKTAYFQMVAYKEGWYFNPQKYQVRFLHPQHPLLSDSGTQRRIYEFQEDSDLNDLSPEKRAGFLVSDNRAIRMKNKQTDSLARRLLKYVFG